MQGSENQFKNLGFFPDDMLEKFEERHDLPFKRITLESVMRMDCRKTRAKAGKLVKKLLK